MKKLLIYILILISLIGVLNTGIKVEAQNSSQGTCVLGRGSYPNQTFEICKRYADFISWTANTASPTPSTSSGVCWQNGTILFLEPLLNYQNYCENNKGGKWQAIGAPLPLPPYGPPATPIPQIPVPSFPPTPDVPTPNNAQRCSSGQEWDYINKKCVTPVVGYQLLVPLPGAGPNGTDLTVFDSAEPFALSTYLNLMIKIILGLAAVLAMVMIVIGGMEYMTSELVSSKEAGKERIRGALLGLLIALGAYALLNTINPDLLNTEISISDATITVSDKDIIVSSNGQVSAGDGGPVNPNSVGTTCDSRTIMSAARSANQTITEGQAATFACLITQESGCQSVTNYNWGRGSSAYGPYQILLQMHSDCFENQACSTAAGVTGPLNCSTGFRNGNPISGSAAAQQCMRAADNFSCSTGAAVCVLRKQGFSAWAGNADSTSKHRECITKYNR
ncbi:hypothetical protein A2818_00125 [Candidatus Nomurabacteria bacterium RIFCSPHIGHO2_01_FULL_40_12]|uniref:Transglycosylase SLT domain-containing protein n=1 Tax=Candidatus Nomurabacteria bacterium RIFCSPHIGHO2_01_FULL_40_12 TaxID=1801737 RepID=A0A1F6V0Q1_9BACT|nr:MAG: hypothetical protein A2818_00125 [Candidatus Nomurabacteria bacterium RIFCSPHIGHO2_01_FULL_40_12]